MESERRGRPLAAVLRRAEPCSRDAVNCSWRRSRIASSADGKDGRVVDIAPGLSKDYRQFLEKCADPWTGAGDARPPGVPRPALRPMTLRPPVRCPQGEPSIAPRGVVTVGRRTECAFGNIASFAVRRRAAPRQKSPKMPKWRRCQTARSCKWAARHGTEGIPECQFGRTKPASRFLGYCNTWMDPPRWGGRHDPCGQPRAPQCVHCVMSPYVLPHLGQGSFLLQFGINRAPPCVCGRP